MKDDSKTNDWWASFVLATCTVIGMLCIAIYVYSTCVMTPKSQTVYIKMGKVDGDDGVVQMNKEQFDSLMTIIENHETQLSEKYQYLIEKKDEEDKLFSIGTMLLGVVIYICGFFGYKSMKSIEEKAKENARDTAVNEARKITESFLKDELRPHIDGLSEQYFNSNAAKVLKQTIISELMAGDNNIIKQCVDDYLNEALISDLTTKLQEHDESEAAGEQQAEDGDENNLFE